MAKRRTPETALPQSILNSMPSENAPHPKPCLLLSQHRSFGHPTSRTGETLYLFQRAFSREGHPGSRRDQLSGKILFDREFSELTAVINGKPNNHPNPTGTAPQSEALAGGRQNTLSRLPWDRRESAGSSFKKAIRIQVDSSIFPVFFPVEGKMTSSQVPSTVRPQPFSH